MPFNPPKPKPGKEYKLIADNKKHRLKMKNGRRVTCIAQFTMNDALGTASLDRDFTPEGLPSWVTPDTIKQILDAAEKDEHFE